MIKEGEGIVGKCAARVFEVKKMIEEESSSRRLHIKCELVFTHDKSPSKRGESTKVEVVNSWKNDAFSQLERAVELKEEGIGAADA